MAPRRALRVAGTLTALSMYSGVALAHGGGPPGVQPERLTVPTWLLVLTGGGVVGASVLLTGFITDRSVIEDLHGRGLSVPAPMTFLVGTGRVVGLAGLGTILLVGFFGPRVARQNAAVLLVWAGWWAGYTMTVYLLGNSWPAIDPFRTLTRPLGSGRVEYPRRLAGWPSVLGLLVLIWIEVVSPLGDDPRFLALVVAVYLTITLAGAVLVGTEAWFANVDPVAAVFRQYGTVAPVRRRGSTLSVTLPGSALLGEPAADRSEAGLVIALVWGTTYDGFVSTPLWADIAGGLVATGVPAPLLYPAVLLGGFVVFAGAFGLGCRVVRRIAPTYLTTTAIVRLFAPSLVAIAAGYHLAHYLSYGLTLGPALVTALASPFRPSATTALALPGWVAGLSIAFVLLGHLLAIWIAHSVAFDRFPSKLQAIRGLYPITAMMIGYTMLSLWIVTRPVTPPPYL